MGEDSPDFFGGALRFVGTVLDVLFRAGSAQNPSLRIWTSDDLSMTDLPPGSLSAASVVTAPQRSMQQRAHDEIAALQQIDPDFNELQFVAQATLQYQAYLAADAAMNPDALTSLATADFVAAYKQRIKQYADAGLRRIAHDLKMLGTTVISVSLDGTRQAIVVRLSSSGVRYVQDIDTGAATEGRAQSDSFTEFGTFVRPPGTTTPRLASTGGAIHCPSCGAPTTAGAPTCPFCGTNLTGTGSTWLLDKVSASAYT